MPFIGRDWRADGELWTKTGIGSWQQRKPVPLSSSLTNLNRSLADIFNALDIVNSVSDMRRFNYIAKVVQILFKEKLRELSGNGQRSLFQILERMIDTALKTGNNIPLMQRIVTQFHNSIQSAYPYYYYIGSGELWRQHIEKLTHMKECIKHIRVNQIKSEEDNSKIKFDCLPIELQNEIIRRLDNGKDIENMGMINDHLYLVTQELLLWRQLCLYHFGDESKNSNQTVFGKKISDLIRRLKKDSNDIDHTDWKKIYFILKRQHGLRDVYAEMIHQCQSCKHLFWQDSDHSCPYENRSLSSSKPITPRKLVYMLI